MSTSYSSDLTGAEWECAQRYLPAVPRRGRPRTRPLRRILDAMFSVVRTDCAWRHLPAEQLPSVADGILPLQALPPQAGDYAVTEPVRWNNPSRLPAGSARIANHPVRGISVFGTTTLPPNAIACCRSPSMSLLPTYTSSSPVRCCNGPPRSTKPPVTPPWRLEPGVGHGREGLHLPAKQVRVEVAQRWRILGGNIDVDDGVLLGH